MAERARERDVFWTHDERKGRASKRNGHEGEQWEEDRKGCDVYESIMFELLCVMKLRVLWGGRERRAKGSR